eukprot:8728710-Ditylum_brightwellii.AAC.1
MSLQDYCWEGDNRCVFFSRDRKCDWVFRGQQRKVGSNVRRGKGDFVGRWEVFMVGGTAD